MLAAGAIAGFNITGKANPGDDGIIGHGGFTYKVNKEWGNLDPAKTPVFNCHEMVEDSKGRLWYRFYNHPGTYYCLYKGRLTTFAGMPADGYVSYQDVQGNLWEQRSRRPHIHLEGWENDAAGWFLHVICVSGVRRPGRVSLVGNRRKWALPDHTQRDRHAPDLPQRGAECHRTGAGGPCRRNLVWHPPWSLSAG